MARGHPGVTVTHRDVGHDPPPHVDEAWIAAAFAPPAERTRAMHAALRTSDELIDELLAADVGVIGVPMYNFGVPSGFKAYIDQIVRVGRTFAFEPEDAGEPYKPLVRGKRVFVVVATGDTGYETGGRYEKQNHLDPYLRTVFRFIGVTDVTFHVGNDEFGGSRLAPRSATHGGASVRRSRRREPPIAPAACGTFFQDLDKRSRYPGPRASSRERSLTPRVRQNPARRTEPRDSTSAT